MPGLSTREVSGEEPPERWLAVLHGIYGAGRNWASVARRVVEERPGWGGLLVDLREHGDSRGFEPPHTLERTAADLEALDPPGPVRAVLGHSFGGKVALLRGRDDPSLEQLWIIDSTPAAGEPRGGAWTVLGVLRAVPEEYETREAAAAALEAEGVAPPVALWLTTNLEPHGDGYRWRLDVDVMEALLRDFFRTDLWDVVEDPPDGLDIHFVRATESGVLGLEEADRLRAAGERTGRVFVHDVAGGHWLNADNPDAVVRLLATHLPDGARPGD